MHPLVQSLIPICAAAAVKYAQEPWKGRLSAEEKDILRAAQRKGAILFMLPEGLPGGFIIVDGVAFQKNDDPSYDARYIDALRLLCEKGMIDPAQENSFRLRAAGWDQVKKLRRSD